MKELQVYGEFQAKIAEVKDACNFIPDVSTDEGYLKSKRVSLDIGKILTAVEKKRKKEKAESMAYGKKVDTEAKVIVAQFKEFQLPHMDAYKELDNLKKEREANRKAKLDERVREIRELPEAMADSDSEGVKMALESLQCEECLDFYEFTQEALKARNASKEKLGEMFGAKLKAEKDAIELSDLRARQVIQDQKDRDERIAKEASEAAELKAAEAGKAEQLAIDQAAMAVKQREEAIIIAKNSEARAKEDLRTAAIQARLAEAKAKKDAEIAAENAKQQQIEFQKNKEAEITRTQTKLEANKAHVGRIRKAAKESFIALGYSEAEAKKLVLAIASDKIDNVKLMV